ncbi:MFS transporter [Moritella yayanosii]|uniref:Multidrug efflux system protein n=1 Tax=Moritella yayanosii TaxID=69539 RepID=A0A330LMB7_9GAMM|nr:MFS transporter [Moritella yayanosii]SQD77779.1 multidrug efflux system protein [Moritella yayanosii]
MFRYLLCSFTLVLLYPTAIDLYLVGLPQIAADLNATESQLHFAFSIYLIGMATTMLIAGKVADSIGRKPVAITGAAIFAVSSIFGGMAEHSTPFLIARFIQGIGAGSCYVVAFAIIRDILDDIQRAKVLSMLNGITCVIPVIAPVIGYLIMLKFPWSSLFIMMAVMGGVVCLLSLLVLKETKPNKLVVINGIHPDRHAVQESFFERFDRSEYSTIVAGTALVSMITSFSAPFALSIFKERTLLLASQILFALSAVIITFTLISNFDNQLYLLSFVLICAGFAIGFGVSMSQALSPYSARAGMASSLLGITQVSCSALYIWLMSALGVNALNMLLTTLIIGSVISLALILLIPKHSHGQKYEKITSPA